MPVAVISIASGMTSAVMSAARKLPSSRNSTTMTSSAPSARFVATVSIVASTSSVRSSTVWARMPGGSARLISLHLGVDRRRDGAAVAADQHQRRADHDLPPFSLALPVRSSLADAPPRPRP